MHNVFHLYQPDAVLVLLCDNIMMLQEVIECFVRFSTKFFVSYSSCKACHMY